nr:MAG TPA: NTP-PPase-like protein [Caudoviricetes sp.]
MNITEWAKEIHENAVAHGWWETKRSTGEVIALIHSELSEALEEARDNRPMMYVLGPNGEEICTPCYFNGRKPEGIAVELADAVIRVLDMAEQVGMPLRDYDAARDELDMIRDEAKKGFEDFGTVIAFLHTITSDLYGAIVKHEAANSISAALAIVAYVEGYLTCNGLDLWQVIEIKHNYNKGRPYKHGKAF